MDLLREIKTFRFTILLHLFVSYLCNNPTNSGAVALTSASIDSILASNELVFINFYADWCRFSNLLAPIFDEAADKVTQEFPIAGQVVMGKVDCDQQTEVAQRFHITKYPTLKVIRNGQPAKREYRGQRSVAAFTEFIKKQLEDPIKEFSDLSELKNLDSKKRIIIGFFDRKDVPEYTTFRRVATNLKDDCQFHVGFGTAMKAGMEESGVSDLRIILGPQRGVNKFHRTPTSDLHVVQSGRLIGDFIKNELDEVGTSHKITFYPDDTSNEEKENYKGNYTHFLEMFLWGSKMCTPLVREINFENAEDITEEGLPLMILFHKAGDEETVRRYKNACQLIKAERNRVNFLHGDGDLFSHPLAHLGKTQDDLPVIAIDSFRHMYLFPNNTELDNPDALERFIEDLYSGKLHREYHFGPDDENESFIITFVEENKEEPSQQQQSSSTTSTVPTTVPSTVQSTVPPTKKKNIEFKPELQSTSNLPESVFVKLQPSRHRYTILRDEL